MCKQHRRFLLSYCVILPKRVILQLGAVHKVRGGGGGGGGVGGGGGSAVPGSALRGVTYGGGGYLADR